jgi:hypothetical protein
MIVMQDPSIPMKVGLNQDAVGRGAAHKEEFFIRDVQHWYPLSRPGTHDLWHCNGGQ